MHIAVSATDEQWTTFTSGREQINWIRAGSCAELAVIPQADAFFDLVGGCEAAFFNAVSKPVFINAVVRTLSQVNAPAHVYRINGWNGFLNKQAWEIAGNIDHPVKELFASLNIKINTVKDEPGFISARVISMIINEAYFALEENVSSKQEIDIAMKLGTNYPYGPFEWASRIGKKNVVDLLQELFKTDPRYKPSALLVKEAEENS
jgi:3-hydroxybutyryl-CoA dehydrogenase